MKPVVTFPSSPTRLFHNLVQHLGLGCVSAALLLALVPSAWAQVPTLTSVTPARGATGVAVNAPLIFTFDQSMNDQLPVIPSIPPFLIGNIEFTPAVSVTYDYAWSAAGRTLTLTPSGDLPPNTTITWKLNPAESALPLSGVDGSPLATTTGSFTTRDGGGGGGGGCTPDGIPDEWGSYSLSKSGDYVQASAADPVPEVSRPFGFAAIVFSPDAGPNATSGSVTLPNATQKPLVAPGVINALLFADTAPKTAAALETSYPAGNYTLRFTQTGQPERVIAMTMPAGNPPVPKFANYNEAQNIDIAQDFTLRWNAFTGASANDHIGLMIIDGLGKTVFQAPNQCIPRELAVTATSVVIPANTFKSGGTYEASLLFSKMFYYADKTIANMVGSGAIANTTRMTFSPGGGGTASSARFTSYKLLPNAEPELTFTGTSGSMYRIERTGNLTPPVSWITVGSVRTDVAGNAVFRDSQAGNLFPFFYRAVSP